MFAELPEYLKREVLFHLEKNNFPKAKEIHDAWLQAKPILTNSLLLEDAPSENIKGAY